MSEAVSRKIRPEVLRTDPSQSSMSILAERCTSLFRRELPGSVTWFPDFEGFQPVCKNLAQPLDTVFFGSFLPRFMESGNWNHPQFRLWTLCDAGKNVLVELLGVPRERISTIPRSRLFPALAPASPLPDLESKMTFIFAGRISATKNIDQLIWISYFLQQEMGLNLQLVLYGPSDDEVHPDRGRWKHEGYAKRIRDLALSLDWINPPVFKGTVPHNEWIQNHPEQPVFISLSSLIYEDFGVALAQAQTAGWPSILSSWGGHRDALAENTLALPPILIGHAHEHPWLIRLRSRALAYRIFKMLSKPKGISVSTHSVETRFLSPTCSQLHEIDQWRRGFVAKTQGAAQLIAREGMWTFADSRPGQTFFERFRDIFSEVDSNPSVVILISDDSPESQIKADEAISKYGSQGFDLTVLTLSDLRQRNGMAAYCNAQNIIVTNQKMLKPKSASLLGLSIP